MDPRRAANVRKIFDNADFIRDLGMELTAVEEGACEVRLVPGPRHRQHHGFVHAGVLATMADHTAGCAARSVVQLHQDVITVEFKINFLRPAVADSLRCRGTVLRGGKTLVVVESEVFGQKDSGETLVAKATVTLAVTPERA